MTQTDKNIVIGLSYTGKELNEFMEANPESEITKKLKQVPQYKEGRLLIPQLMYFKVVSTVHHHGRSERTLELSLERDFLRSPRGFGKLGGWLHDRK